MRRFEITEKGASKFWSGEVDGVTLTTSWGESGAAAASKSQDLGTNEAALAELARLVEEQLGKGYVEVAGEAGPGAGEPEVEAAKPSKAGGAAKAAKPKAKAKAAAPAGPPPFPGVELRAIKALATKLAKLGDSHRIRGAVDKVVGDGDRHALVWYMIVHGLVDAAQHDALIDFLSGSDIDAAGAVALASLLERRKDTVDDPRGGGTHYAAWIPGWTIDLDALVYRAIGLAPEAFAEHEAKYGEQARLGLGFVRRRRGERIEAGLAARILAALALAQATGYGISSGGDLPFVGDDGKEVAHRAGNLADLRTVALRFGSAADWDTALQAAVKVNRWGLIENVESALAQLPLDELSQVFATRGDQRLFSDSSNATETVLRIMEARGDEPEALLAGPRYLPESTSDAALVRELYATVAARRLAAAGKPVPTSFDDAMAAFQLIDDRYAVDAVLEALRAVPAERVLSMVKKALPDAWSKVPVAALGAHFDAAILDEVLAAGGYVSEDYLAAIGAPAVLPLARAARAAQDPDVRRSRHQAMLLAMGRAVAAGEAPPASWDALLELGQIDGQPVKGWSPSSTSGEKLGAVLAAMPPERRDGILRAAMAASPSIAAHFVYLGSDGLVDEAARLLLGQRKLWRSLFDQLGPRIVDPLVRHIGECQGDAEVMDVVKRGLRPADYARVEAALGGAKESKQAALARLAAAALAADPGGARERVYLVERADDDHPARVGSLSRAGGRAPGLADDALPKDDQGEPLEHLLTIDFDDVPELRPRYPGARALAVLCPEPSTGERNEETELVPIPATAPVPVPSALGEEGHALAITGIDAPASVFGKGERPPEVEALRQAIWKAGSHILGKPLWIQGDEGGDDEGLLLQINDGLVPDLNLGDVGSLYVFENGSSVYQCH